MGLFKRNDGKLSVGEVATFSLGTLGREVSCNCINSFFLVYLCIYMRLNPLYMTIAFVLAKIWDAVNDPMLATIVNNSRKTRFGRYVPWMLIGTILNAIILIFMFVPLKTPNEGLKYFYYIVMYVLWGMSYTIMDVPYWTMLPTIAATTEERNKVSSFAKLIGGFGGFTIGTIGTSVVLPLLSGKGMERAYLVLGVVGGAILLVFMLFPIAFNRERYEIPYNKVGLKEIFGMFGANDQLRAYAGAYVLYNIGTTLALLQLLYLYVYCYENGADYLNSAYSYTMFWIIACTGQGIAMVFYNFLAKKLSRERIFSATYLLAIVSYVMLFCIFFFLKPANGKASIYWLNTILVAVSGACLMLASGMNQIGSTVMIADVVDYGEWKNGKRGDSLIFSVQTLLQKFAGAFGMLVLGIGIIVAGLPSVREYFDPTHLNTDGSLGAVVQEFVDTAGNRVDGAKLINGNSLTILRVFMFLVPIPFCLAGYVIYKRKYRLFGSTYEDIHAEITRRREENK